MRKSRFREEQIIGVLKEVSKQGVIHPCRRRSRKLLNSHTRILTISGVTKVLFLESVCWSRIHVVVGPTSLSEDLGQFEDQSRISAVISIQRGRVNESSGGSVSPLRK